MKKVITGLFLIMFSVLMLNVKVTEAETSPDQLPANCIVYNDWCNTCGRGEGWQWACTMMACLNQPTPTTYTCTAYSDTGAVVKEGELTNGSVSPEYARTCVAWLSTVNPSNAGMVWGGMLCYDPAKGEPVCKKDGVIKEGWYYSNGALLRPMNCPTTEQPTACTMQYDPVCAAVQVECIRAPCPPIPETFGNSCMMEANPRATFLYKGECKAVQPTEPTKVCTKEYMPVCGVTQTKPTCDWNVCYPIDQVQQTYGNKCTLEADNARLLYAGECKSGLEAGEWFVYGKVASVLDQSYLAWQYTPIQAYNYTQTIIDKIDAKLKVSRMQKWAYDKHIQLKRFLQTYMTMSQITQ